MGNGIICWTISSAWNTIRTSTTGIFCDHPPLVRFVDITKSIATGRNYILCIYIYTESKTAFLLLHLGRWWMTPYPDISGHTITTKPCQMRCNLATVHGWGHHRKKWGRIYNEQLVCTIFFFALTWFLFLLPWTFGNPERPWFAWWLGHWHLQNFVDPMPPPHDPKMNETCGKPTKDHTNIIYMFH